MPGAFVKGDIAGMIEALGRSATFRGNSINIMFINEFDDVVVMDQAVEMQNPQCLVETSDIADIAHREILIINSINYYVTGKQPNGTGITRLILSKD